MSSTSPAGRKARRHPARNRACVSALLLAGLLTAACSDTSNNALPGRSPSSGPGGPSSHDAGTSPDAGRPGAGDGGDDGLAQATDGSSRLREPGYLWYAGGALSAFTKSETESSNQDGPGWLTQLSYPAKNFHDLAFDGAGNLWTIPLAGDRLLRVPADHLGDILPVPDLVVSSPALRGADSLVFDAEGNLWVMCSSGVDLSIANIVRFDNPGTLSGPQTLAPSLTIGPGTSPESRAAFTQGTAIAFDRAGSLWFAAIASVLRFDQVSGLAGQIQAAPAAVVSTGDALVSLAFDPAGALWLTGASKGYTASRIDNPGALAGTVKPTIAARVHLPTTPSTLFAGGMAFDATGALWVITSDRILQIAGASALAGEVTPAPGVILGNIAFPDLATKLVIRPLAPAPAATTN
jgi:streptogramin lyase